MLKTAQIITIAASLAACGPAVTAPPSLPAQPAEAEVQNWYFESDLTYIEPEPDAAEPGLGNWTPEFGFGGP